MSVDIEIKKGFVIPKGEIKYTTARSGGSGGQHVNKSETKVMIWWNVDASAAMGSTYRIRIKTKLASHINEDGFLQLTCETERSQYLNKKEVREKFKTLILAAIKIEKRRKKTKPSRSQKERRLKNKRKKSEKKNNRKNDKFDD